MARLWLGVGWILLTVALAQEQVVDKVESVVVDKEEQVVKDTEQQVAVDKEGQVLIDKEEEVLVDKEEEVLEDSVSSLLPEGWILPSWMETQEFRVSTGGGGTEGQLDGTDLAITESPFASLPPTS